MGSGGGKGERGKGERGVAGRWSWVCGRVREGLLVAVALWNYSKR